MNSDNYCSCEVHACYLFLQLSPSFNCSSGTRQQVQSRIKYETDENVHARATRGSKTGHRSCSSYLDYLRDKQAISENIILAELDVVMLHNDPSEDATSRPWARLAGINFAMRQGVLVVNDSEGLTQAVNKLYLQQFPAKVRPTSLITRDRNQIKEVSAEMGGTIVLTPLVGSGGHNVFLLRPEDIPNANQMIDTVSRDGYIIAQQYLPDAIHGDTRLFMLNGQPLCHKGQYAALRRLRSDGDMRNNMTAGASSAPAIINDDILEIAKLIRPQLLHDGMFFVGQDIVGNKLMEINVFSPRGLESASAFTNIKFNQVII